MNEITDDFGNWLAGFTDGEGHFQIAKQNGSNPRTNYKCRFRIGLRDDDKAILEEIHYALGIGTISANPIRDKHNGQPQTRFCVNALDECAELMKLFDRYPLRAKKQQDFEVWKLAVAELLKPRRCRDADLLEYYFLKIKEVRKYEKQVEISRPITIDVQLTIRF